ncbi:hypothetical protein [Streptomyces sp. NPDC086023]|uniref:hypothetical protein n=1 Tax=Streptomyces sp. NPDC086023 TaxID=3365746 RepID=UPI0037D8C9CC
MTTTQSIEVLVDAGEDADARGQEEARAEVQALLEELGVDEVAPRAAEAAPGSKSEGLASLTELAVTVGPTLFPALLTAFEGWVQWAASRRVWVKIGGNEYAASGLTRAQRQQLLDHFIAQSAAPAAERLPEQGRGAIDGGA